MSIVMIAFLINFGIFQAKFLLRCPSLDARFSACPDPNYGHICFYSNEWACGNQCIGKTDICEFRTSNPMFNGININSGCDWGKYILFVSSKKGLVIFSHNCSEIGMKRCDNVCVDRHTPCHGICWDESSIHKCGDNMCLSQYQLQVIHSNLDIVNKPVIPFLFTILNNLLYQI